MTNGGGLSLKEVFRKIIPLTVTIHSSYHRLCFIKHKTFFSLREVPFYLSTGTFAIRGPQPVGGFRSVGVVNAYVCIVSGWRTTTQQFVINFLSLQAVRFNP